MAKDYKEIDWKKVKDIIEKKELIFHLAHCDCVIDLETALQLLDEEKKELLEEINGTINSP